MIDLHCHLLPGVDDGPQSVNEAIALVQQAVANGITHAVVTPHIHPTRYPNTLSTLRKKFEAFQTILTIKKIPIHLRLGGELRVEPESLDLLLADEVPFLGTVGGYRIVLLEFPHQTIPVGSDRFVRKLFDLGIRPLIAHPERNRSVIDKPERIRPFVEMGCWLQITAASLTGGFGQKAKETAEYLLQQEWVWLIATDAHNLEHRPPLMREGANALVQKVGLALAQAMVIDRPAAIYGVS